MTRTYHTITPAELRDSWTNLMEGRPGPEHKQGHIEGYGTNPDEVHGFAGMSGREIMQALRDGYYPEPNGDVISATAYGSQEIMVQQIFVNEENGELLIDQALAGEDEFYVTLDHQPANVGVDMRIQFDTNAVSSVNVLGDYFEWCLHVIDALERKGVAPSVTLTQELYGTLRGDKQDRTILIPLVQEGEVIDPVTWRAFMTKGAFRTLGFLSIGILATRLKKRTTEGLGHARPGGFSVEYDPEDGVLAVTCPGCFPDSFPAERMTAMLDRILEEF